MRRLPLFVVGSLASAAALLACGASRLPEPPRVSHPTSALVEVPYPPPPARVEYVPRRPRSDAVWIDGEWVWQLGAWAWRPGRWVAAPRGAAFAPWTTVRSEAGILYVAEGRFRDPDGAAIEGEQVLAVGLPRGGPVVTPEGEVLPATRRAALPSAIAEAGRARDDDPRTAASEEPPDWDAGIEPLDATFDEDVIALPTPPELRKLDPSP